MKHICFLVMTVMFFPTSLLFAETETEEDALTILANKFFTLYEKEQLNKIPKLFHFPPNSSPDAKAKDTKFIIASTRAFLRKFGNTGTKKLVSYQEQCYDFRFGAGTDEYWAEHLDFERITYKASFSEVGTGYILFDFCKISTEWQIGFVRFALPASSDSADQIMSDIGKLIWELMEK